MTRNKHFIEQQNVQLEEKWFDNRAGKTIHYNPLHCIKLNNTNEYERRFLNMILKTYNTLKEELDIWIFVFLSFNELKARHKDFDYGRGDKVRTNKDFIKELFFRKAYKLLNLDISNRNGLSDQEIELIIDNMENIFNEMQKELFHLTPLIPFSFKSMVENYKKMLKSHME